MIKKTIMLGLLVSSYGICSKAPLYLDGGYGDTWDLVNQARYERDFGIDRYLEGRGDPDAVPEYAREQTVKEIPNAPTPAQKAAGIDNPAYLSTVRNVARDSAHALAMIAKIENPDALSRETILNLMVTLSEPERKQAMAELEEKRQRTKLENEMATKAIATNK